MLDALGDSPSRHDELADAELANNHRRFDELPAIIHKMRTVVPSAELHGDAERTIRPLAVGWANWLQIGGDGGLKIDSVLLSICASATRHRLNPS